MSRKPASRARAKNATVYSILWTDPASGTDITIRITQTRNHLSAGQDHVEIESLKPKHAPLPVTETGYVSHFLPALELVNAGGAVTFVTAWLEREARGKAWQTAVAKRAQGDLFAWADAQCDVTAKPKRQAKPPVQKAVRPKTTRQTKLRQRKHGRE